MWMWCCVSTVCHIQKWNNYSEIFYAQTGNDLFFSQKCSCPWANCCFLPFLMTHTGIWSIAVKHWHWGIPQGIIHMNKPNDKDGCIIFTIIFIAARRMYAASEEFPAVPGNFFSLPDHISISQTLLTRDKQKKEADMDLSMHIGCLMRGNRVIGNC